MKRSWTLWLVFAVCVAIVVAALAWVSLIVLQLEKAGAQSQRQALLEENTRLALWRMESMTAPFVAQENARPYYSYQAFFPAERAYTRMLARLEPNEILIPSPLLTGHSPHVRLYFQLGPAGELSSPQIPAASIRGKEVESYLSPGQIEESARRLKQFAETIPRFALLEAAPFEWLPMERPNGAGGESASIRKAAARPFKLKDIKPVQAVEEAAGSREKMNLAEELLTNSPAQVANQVVTIPQQQQQITRNDIEYQSRSSNAINQQEILRYRAMKKGGGESEGIAAPHTGTDESTAGAADSKDRMSGNEQMRNAQEDSAGSASSARHPPNPPMAKAGLSGMRAVAGKPAEIKTGLLKAAWIHGELILVRRVQINEQEFLQGCWLDWPQLQSWLTGAIRDLLPQARLEPGKEGNDQGRSLAALPILIQPGPITEEPVPFISPLRMSLWVAWFCVLAAILATAILFWGTHALSERRAAFVSAVTHELRTPLTTFRLYAEMLAEGMVPDAEQRRQYLTTLKQEADRQFHLIENVLAYSRMERGRYGGQKEILFLGAWLERIRPRLEVLAERAGMVLDYAGEDASADLSIATDAAALERILFNLVDNACKYAASAADKRVHIEVVHERRKVRIRVRDHGPGIASGDVSRLFKPFHKSARDAANSAPGVGLGLSLCRRLAHGIGGELTLDRVEGAGASFSVILPYMNKR